MGGLVGVDSETVSQWRPAERIRQTRKAFLSESSSEVRQHGLVPLHCRLKRVGCCAHARPVGSCPSAGAVPTCIERQSRMPLIAAVVACACQGRSNAEGLMRTKSDRKLRRSCCFDARAVFSKSRSRKQRSGENLRLLFCLSSLRLVTAFAIVDPSAISAAVSPCGCSSLDDCESFSAHRCCCCTWLALLLCATANTTTC